MFCSLTGSMKIIKHISSKKNLGTCICSKRKSYTENNGWLQIVFAGERKEWWQNKGRGKLERHVLYGRTMLSKKRLVSSSRKKATEQIETATSYSYAVVYMLQKSRALVCRFQTLGPKILHI